MKAELSQLGLYANQQLSGVYQQQGRMLVDRDWNELCDILRNLGRIAASETIGTGVPRHGGMISSPSPGALNILNSGGLVAADGIIGGSKPRATGNLYLNQASLPATVPDFAHGTNPPLLTAPPTARLLYVDLWDRMVNAFEIADFVDPALHGADTCVRTQRMVQIKSATPADVSRLDPCTPLLSFPQKGNAVFNAQLTPAGEAADDCDPCADQATITRSVPNRLFRLEVHSVQFTGPNPTGVTLKWSLDNGAVEFKASDYATRADSATHSYEFFSTATEMLLGVPSGDWPAEALLRGTFDPPNPADPMGAAAIYPRVREWDGWCRLSLAGANWSVVPNVGRYAGQPLGTIAAIAANTLTITLNDQGFQFTLALAGSKFLAGDYWLAVMRTRAPDDASRVKVISPAPLGVDHRYCVLGVAGAAGTITTLTSLTDFDLRRLQHPSLTCLDATDIGYSPSCSYLTSTFVPAGPIHNVAEALEALCVEPAQFVPYTPACGYLNTVLNGNPVGNVAEALDALCVEPAQYVPFTPACGYLKTALNGNPVENVAEALEALCVEPAQYVPFTPVCGYLNTALNGNPVENVAEALEALCQRPSLRPLPTLASANWLNDLYMSYDTFASGLTVTFSEPIDARFLSSDVFIVTMECSCELLQQFDDVDELLTPQIVLGSVKVSPDGLSATFMPSTLVLNEKLANLATIAQRAGADFIDVRCRVRLLGRGIFSADGTRALDGYIPMKPTTVTAWIDRVGDFAQSSGQLAMAARAPGAAGAAPPASTGAAQAAIGGGTHAPLPPAPPTTGIIFDPVSYVIAFDGTSAATPVLSTFNNPGMGWVSDFESWFYVYATAPNIVRDPARGAEGMPAAPPPPPAAAGMVAGAAQKDIGILASPLVPPPPPQIVINPGIVEKVLQPGAFVDAAAAKMADPALAAKDTATPAKPPVKPK